MAGIHFSIPITSILEVSTKSFKKNLLLVVKNNTTYELNLRRLKHENWNKAKSNTEI